MVWEELVVLCANGGQCLYCGSESQEKDHVIPFEDGGSDELKNLLPICGTCNKKKGKKNPAVWHVAMDLTLRWHGDGSVLDGASLGNKSLRELYLLTHLQVLEALEEIELVQAEVVDERRLAWFRRHFQHWGYGSPGWGTAVIRSKYGHKIQEGKESGYPTFWEENPELAEVYIARRGKAPGLYS